MKTYVAFEMRVFLKNKKNHLILVIFSLFLLILLFFIYYQGVGYLEQQVHYDLQNNSIAMERFNRIKQQDPTIRPSYENVLKQQRAIANQDVNLRFGNERKYIEASLKLAELRIQGQREGYKGIPSRFFVDQSRAEKDQLFYRYLLAYDLPLSTNGLNGASYLSVVIQVMGYASFFLLLLLGCDLLVSDEEHGSLVHSYPMSVVQRISAKMVIQILLSSLLTFGLIALGTGMVSLFFGAGIFHYPVVYGSIGQFQVMTILQQSLLYGFYFLLLATHVYVLCAFLNTILKNMYLTIFVGSFLYLFPFLFKGKTAFLKWIPFTYYPFTAVFEGTFSAQFQIDLDFLSAFLILTFWSLVFLFLTSFATFFDKLRSVHSLTGRRG